MATDVVMPRLSDTMDSGTIARWLKQEGDEIKRGDILAEIETDKANMELEAYANGVLAQILVGEGQSASLGAPIAVIAASADEARSLQQRPSGQAEPAAVARPAETASPNGQSAAQTDQDVPSQGPPAAPQAAGQVEPEERVKASPLARRLAQEHGITLRDVDGTGPGGRITKEDVQAFLRQAAPAGTSGQSELASREPDHAPASPQPQGSVRAAQPAEMSRMQQTIARRLTEARFGAPDFLLTAEWDLTEARVLLKSIASVEGAPRIGPNDLLIKAIAAGLARHPNANAGWENDTVTRYGSINVGVAVATPGGGLVVPVVRDADKKTLGQIAQESKTLIEKARTNKLAPAEREGGTFTISNLGMYGIDQFTSILNPPEACSLAVGAITPKPVVIDGDVVVRDRMRVTLTCDHRVINGAEGAEFLRTVGALLAHPLMSLI